jgi:acetolactate decarboxylase
MPLVSANIPESLKSVMDAPTARLRTNESAVITAALSKYLGIPVHTLFQVSTSGALVAGVYDREVSVKSILEHGDFGLGTFANLDGEMVVLDGRAFQVKGNGRVLEAPPDAGAPFAVVTHFSPEIPADSGLIASFWNATVIRRMPEAERSELKYLVPIPTATITGFCNLSTNTTASTMCIQRSATKTG